jgi:hypothetical protein
MGNRVWQFALLTISAAAALAPSPGLAQSEIIDGWTDLLISVSRLVIIFASLLGIAYAATSLFRAYRADFDEARTRHLFAAMFAGLFTIIGVIIGWISGLLIPGA